LAGWVDDQRVPVEPGQGMEQNELSSWHYLFREQAGVAQTFFWG